MMPTKRLTTQVCQNRNFADENGENMQNYGMPGCYVPPFSGRGGGGNYGLPGPRRFSLPPTPYSEERRNFYNQNRYSGDTPKNSSNNKQRRRGRETRSQSRNRKSNNTQTPQQIRNARRRSMDNHMYPGNQSNRRHGGAGTLPLMCGK